MIVTLVLIKKLAHFKHNLAVKNSILKLFQKLNIDILIENDTSKVCKYLKKIFFLLAGVII